MNWSKAKSILIIALLVTNMLLGGLILAERADEKKEEAEALRSTEAYLAAREISINAQIPDRPDRLPVLFVCFNTNGKPDEKKQAYKGIPLISTSEDKRRIPVIDAAGKGKAKLRGLSGVLFELYEELGEGFSIEEIELVYRLESENNAELQVDTAYPNWRIQTSEGEFFLSAFYE